MYNTAGDLNCPSLIPVPGRFATTSYGNGVPEPQSRKMSCQIVTLYSGSAQYMCLSCEIYGQPMSGHWSMRDGVNTKSHQYPPTYTKASALLSQ